MSWLKRLFGPRREPIPLLALEAAAPVPPWALELLEAVQKVGRAQARSMARIEALESKLEGGFSDLRSTATSRPAGAPCFERLMHLIYFMPGTIDSHQPSFDNLIPILHRYSADYEGIQPDRAPRNLVQPH